jgi:hypothetical protein
VSSPPIRWSGLNPGNSDEEQSSTFLKGFAFFCVSQIRVRGSRNQAFDAACDYNNVCTQPFALVKAHNSHRRDFVGNIRLLDRFQYCFGQFIRTARRSF